MAGRTQGCFNSSHHLVLQQNAKLTVISERELLKREGLEGMERFSVELEDSAEARVVFPDEAWDLVALQGRRMTVFRGNGNRGKPWVSATGEVKALSSDGTRVVAFDGRACLYLT